MNAPSKFAVLLGVATSLALGCGTREPAPAAPRSAGTAPAEAPRAAAENLGEKARETLTTVVAAPTAHAALVPPPTAATAANVPSSSAGVAPARSAEVETHTKAEPRATGIAEPAAKPPALLPGATAASDTTAATKEKPKPLRKGKHSGIPFDPIKENGPIFVDWPTPEVALVITGREDGYMEPCGCAGLDRMKGGLSRRLALFRMLREKGWPLVALDVGGNVKGFGRQAEQKFQLAMDAMLKMGYDAVGLGLADLQLPAGVVVANAGATDKYESGMFVGANVGLFGFEAQLTPKFRVISAGGRKIGVTAVLGLEYQKELHNSDVALADPVQAIKEVLPELKKQADFLVLLAHATRQESIDLAKQFPDFNLVVTAGGGAEPPSQPSPIEGTPSQLIEVGEKGMNAIVIGLYNDPQQPLRYQRVPLDSRFTNAPEVMMLMASYQDHLKELGLDGLGVRPVPHPKRESNGRFVGSQKCESCHDISYNIWKKTGHARAWNTLVTTAPPRNHDPECISCHVVGWNPTQYFPYQSGFESAEKTPDLENTGCEDCHGPGEKHVAAELGADTALQERLRKAMVITKEDSKKWQCRTCHDLDNSPDFEFETYWPYVEHSEK